MSESYISTHFVYIPPLEIFSLKLCSKTFLVRVCCMETSWESRVIFTSRVLMRAFLTVTCNLWPVTWDLWPVTWDLGPVTCDLWPVTCDLWKKPAGCRRGGKGEKMSARSLWACGKRTLLLPSQNSHAPFDPFPSLLRRRASLTACSN